MKKLWQFPWGLVWLLTLALMPEPAFAVDNTLLITPCAAGCITTKSKDIGAGVQAPQPVLSDASGNVLGMPTAGADAVSNTVLGLQGYNYPFWFNGVTWDRARGDATNGAFVNVKTSVLPTGAATAANQGLVTTWGGGTLGAMANYGTSPGAVLVPGVNSFITNVPAVSQSGTWNVTNISGAISLPTGAATAANQATEISSLATIATNTGAAIPAGTANIGNVGQISQYPTGATAITASATGTTGATTATLAGTGGKTTFICGYSIRANATAATTVTNTITGTITATLSSIMWVAPAASGIGVDEMVFSPCIPASATNTGIAIVSGAPGTGGTVSSKGWGYQL